MTDRIAFSAGIVGIVLSIGQVTTGQTMLWVHPPDVVGDWMERDNWIFPVPEFSPEQFWHFTIDGRRIAQLSIGDVRGAYGVIGEVGDGSLLQTGGSLILGEGLTMLGRQSGSQGSYELSGGSSSFDTLIIGEQGDGNVRVSGGTLQVDRSIHVANSTGSGTVLQSGGVVGTSERRTDIRIGTSGHGRGRYELSGGEFNATEMFIRNGEFIHSGGTVNIAEWLELAGVDDGSVVYHFDVRESEPALLTRSIHLNGHGETITPDFIHDIGSIETRFVHVTNGSYLLNQGLLQASELTVGTSVSSRLVSNGVFDQNGGTVKTDVLSVEGFSNRDRIGTGHYELNNGTVYARRLAIRSDATALFRQNNGLLVLSDLDLEGHTGSAGIELGNGTVLINDRLIAEGSGAYMDLGNSNVYVQTGVGSHLLLRDDTIRNGQNASVVVGSDSIIGVPAATRDSLLEMIQHNNVVTYEPGETITVLRNQRAQVGGLDERYEGLVVEGFVYDSPLRGPAVAKDLIVRRTGRINFDHPEAEVNIRSRPDSGVFGGVAVLNDLIIRGRDQTIGFRVWDGGHLKVNNELIVRDNQRFSVNDSEIDVFLGAFGRGGTFHQVSGRSSFEHLTTSHRDIQGRGKINVEDGQLMAKEVSISASGEFNQTGGEVAIDLLWLSSTYNHSGGTLTINNELLVRSNTATIDFKDSDATIWFDGAIVDLINREPFENAKLATFVADENSLLIVSRNTDLPSQFGVYRNDALIQVAGEPILIPAGREINGSGTISRITVAGRVIAQGRGLSFNDFSIEPDATVDLGLGGASVPENTISTVKGSSLRGTWLYVAGKLRQLAGDVSFKTVKIAANASYDLVGGSLRIGESLTSGRIDFGEAESALILDEFAHLDLTNIQVVESQFAKLEARRHSTIFATRESPPDSMFANFSSDGLIHFIGEELHVGDQDILAGQLEIQGSIINEGTIRPGLGVGGLRVVNGDYQQLPQGVLEIEIEDHPDSVRRPDYAFDEFAVDGGVTLAGTLSVDLIDGFMPTAGDQYSFLYVSQGSLSGRFDHVEVDELIAGLKTNLIYNENWVILEFLSRSPTDDFPLGDFNENGHHDVQDIDALTRAVQLDQYRASFDVNGDGFLDHEDRRLWVVEERRTYFGDANLDGLFSTADLVQVFQHGHFEDEFTKNSTWESGDWNGDGEFTTTDLVMAFVGGGFESGPRAGFNVVPEPANLVPFVFAWIIFCFARRSLRIDQTI